MEKAKITFVNGEEITLSEGQLLFPVSRMVQNNEVFASRQEPVELLWHVHDGLIPAITDMLCSCDFFSVKDDCNKLYKTSAVFSVEQE